MTKADITHHRLLNQQIASTKFKKPQDMVDWLVAMQAQEYAMAKWSIGLRLPGSTDASVEKAFNEGAILRTHLLRPTWHFATPADIRWLLTLTAPRVHALNAYWYRKFGLNTKMFNRCNDALIKALEGGKHLTRSTLKAQLERVKIVADGLRLIYLLMHAELEGIICSGPREGKQFTYALLDERVPSRKALDKEQALAELTRRYFASRGPATLQDLANWSGLTLKEVKEGAALLPKSFEREKIEGKEYLFLPSKAKITDTMQTTFLMPDYDEYGMSYKDRSALMNKEVFGRKEASVMYSRMIVINGLIEGTWKRVINGKKVAVETVPFVSLSKVKKQAMEKAVKKYCLFVGKEVED